MFKVRDEAGTARATVYLYGTIGADWWDEDSSNTAKEFAKTLEALDPKPLDIRIDSSGGDVYEGFAIASAIQRYGGETVAYIDGLAASAASYIAEVCGHVVMNDYAQIMIHKAWTVASGNSDDLLAMVDRLDAIDDNIAGLISKRSGMGVAEVREAMRAETWYSAADALDAGLCDEVIETKERVAACVLDARVAGHCRRVPASVAVADMVDAIVPAAQGDDAAEAESHGGPNMSKARTEGTVLLGNHVYRTEGEQR